MQDVNSLESHLLQAGLVDCSGAAAVGSGLRDLGVVLVDVSVQPLGHVGHGEDTQSALSVGSVLKSGVVLDDVVALVAELLIIIQALEGFAAGNELFGTTTEKHIGSSELRPCVVLDAVEEGIYDARHEIRISTVL